MPEPNKPFVITDRRRFSLEGELRPDADPSPEREVRAVTPSPISVPEPPPPAPEPVAEADFNPDTEPEMPPPPTAAEMEQARAAYIQTAERLDGAMRAANPAMDRAPAVSFEQILQSIYMTAIMQLGGNTPEGQQPQVDLMAARQSVDMLGILAEKTKGNLTPAESTMLDSALFELRMGFLEVTQAMARTAASRAQQPPGRPSIVR